MFNSQMPALADLPTSRQLVGSTALALTLAGALLLGVVLPSEYAIDPTGIGRALGLTEMGEIKVQLAEEAAADAARDAAVPSIGTAAVAPATPSTAAAAAQPVAGRADTTRLVLAPGEGAEVKFSAATGARVAFTWSVAGGAVNYDTHADAPGIKYHGYGKGKASAGESGTLVAAFEGKHGWFWRNRGTAPVTIMLTTRGNYSGIRRVV